MRRGSITLLVFTLAVAVSAAFAEDPAPSSPAECVQRLDLVLADVVQFHTVLANKPGRQECVGEVIIKLRVLTEFGRQAVENIKRLEQVQDEEAALAERERLLAMTLRANLLSETARRCTGTTTTTSRYYPTPKAKPATKPTTKPAAKAADSTSRLPAIPHPAWPVRTEAECVRQATAARLLARAVGLDGGAGETVVVKALSARQIEPLGGWQLAQCLSLDDFVVAVARALALEVADPEDPSSCLQALREAGFAVDQMLPPRKTGLPVYLAEQEVRAFLAAGRVTPLQRAYAPIRR
jgi:hypothetical protein